MTRLAPCRCGHPGLGCSCYEERRAEADTADRPVTSPARGGPDDPYVQVGQYRVPKEPLQPAVTAAVPDPSTCKCGHSQTAHPVPTDCVRCTCTDYRPAVPDPRFRNQLAGWLFDFSMKARGVAARWADPSIGIPGDDGAELLSDKTLRDSWRSEADWLIEDVIAAEVEARVQDAVERAAQAVEALRPHIPPSTDPNRRTSVIVRSTLNRAARAVRAAVLAQPAPGGRP